MTKLKEALLEVCISNVYTTNLLRVILLTLQLLLVLIQLFLLLIILELKNTTNIILLMLLLSTTINIISDALYIYIIQF